MINSRWATFRGKRVLLLQGPVGPFFWRLAKVLEQVGARVHKVNFNGGDWLFYPTGATAWRGSMADWPAYFEHLLEELEIDIVVLFGDCRPIHRPTRQIALRHGVTVGAFEEGYVRPNFITFEQFGVNGYSLLPRDPLAYSVLADQPNSPEREVGNAFWHAALWATLYYIASALLHPLFRRYHHHRPLTIREAWPWARSAWRKVLCRWTERGTMELLTGSLSGKFYLAPLQISFDSQVKQHSEFASVTDFIRKVVASFAAHAPADTALVVKHHPLDRGYHDYRRLIRQLAADFGLGQRLHYIHDQHLPTLFQHMRGAVVINSTVGFSSLTHGAALKACGVAIYNLDRLTFQGSLDEFWAAACTFCPEMDLFARFRSYLINHTQINGSFYKGGIDPNLCTSMASLQTKDLTPASEHTFLIEARVSAEVRSRVHAIVASGSSQPLARRNRP